MYAVQVGICTHHDHVLDLVSTGWHIKILTVDLFVRAPLIWANPFIWANIYENIEDTQKQLEGSLVCLFALLEAQDS